MGKKRKVGSRYGEPKADRNDDSKLAINSWEDVADSEDEFHINRDKVLLDDGPVAKRAKKWKEEDKFLEPSDEEVLDYSDAGDDDEDYGSESGDEAEDAGLIARKQDAEEEEEEEEEDLGGWGPSKKDYYDADAIETEQDALDEEAEARRIQKKQLQSMTEADFGFDEDQWLAEDGEQDVATGDVVTEKLPQLQITEDMTNEEKKGILRTRYPEFDYISKEYMRLQPLHEELASAANASERLVKARAAKSGGSSGDIRPTPMAVTKYRACAAYMAAMAMYFAILGSTATADGSNVVAFDPAELHEHPVMESLLRCQKLWARIETLPVADPMVEASNGDELSVIEEASPAVEPEHDVVSAPEKKLKKSKAQRAAEAAQTKSQAVQAQNLAKTEQELASLDTLTDKSALRKATKQKKIREPESKMNLLNADDSDFGEETGLTAHELAEKARKKKSLRFYTSQIAQKANKRDAAGRDYGGDMDVPHRERLKDRQARLQAEAEKRGQNRDKGPGVPLGEGSDSVSEDEAEDTRNGAGYQDDDGYYDMVAARGNAKKQAKLEQAAAYAQAAKEGGTVVPEETIGEDGRRQISYAIEKNKGLHSKRKKVNRNPRVKKKVKYADKTKKLKSMKPTFDASKKAKGAASYGGELTGIKKGLVRSTRL